MVNVGILKAKEDDILRWLKRFIILGWKGMLEYKIELFYLILLSVVNVGAGAIIWYMMAQPLLSYGWSFPQLLVLYLTTNIGVACSGAIGIFNAIYLMSRKRWRSWLVSLLTKPLHPLLLLLGTCFSFSEVASLIIYTAALIFVLLYFHLAITIEWLFLTICGILIGVLFIFMVLFFIIAYEENAMPLVDIVNALVYKFSQIPLPMKGIGGILFTWIVPIVFISTVPAKALFVSVPMVFVLTSIAFVLLLALLDYALWKYALARFEAIGE